MANSQPNSQIDLFPAAAVLAVLAIAALLWVRERNEYAAKYVALQAPTNCVPAVVSFAPILAPNSPRDAIAVHASARRADGATTDQANDASASATFARALELLASSEPDIAPLARQFLDKLFLDSVFLDRVRAIGTSAQSPELAAALIALEQRAFAAALEAVRMELGTLAQREPDAFVHNADMTSVLPGSRPEVHADRHGKRRPMLVVYAHGQGLGYAIPASEAGRRLALLHITHHEAREPEWFAFALQQSR